MLVRMQNGQICIRAMHFCMNWQNTSFDWNRARAFLVSAEEGSFSAAARALGSSQPTLGRQVAALEAELGLALFERVGTRLVLTASGLDLVEQLRAMNEAATRVSMIAAGHAQTLEGVVRIAASEAISAYLLPPIIDDLRARHPGIQIELVVSNATSDLRRREADLAVRNFRPRGDDLVAKLIKEASHAHLYAAPSYLARIGNPRTPAALAARGHVIGFDETPRLREALAAQGLSFAEDRFPVRTENHLVQWELAKQGLGMCVMMEEIGDREPRVQRALPAFATQLAFPTWLTSHRELKTSRRHRVVFDLVAEGLTRAMAIEPVGRPRGSRPRDARRRRPRR